MNDQDQNHEERISLVDGLPPDTTSPKLCINCNHYYGKRRACKRNIKLYSSMNLVSGQEYVAVGDLLDCELERLEKTHSVAERLIRFMKGIEKGQMRFGACGPKAKFFEPKETKPNEDHAND